MSRKERAYRTAGVYAIAFLLLTILLRHVDVNNIGADGTNIGLSHFNGAIHNLIGVHVFLYYVTSLMCLFALVAAAYFVIVAVAQIIGRRSLFKVDRGIWGLFVVYLIMICVYLFFEIMAVNYRPTLMPGYMHPERSYPSSHMLLCGVVFSTGMIEWKRLFRSRPELLEKLNKASLGILLIVSVGGLLSGVVWFTDILASILVSISLMNLYRGISLVPRDAEDSDERRRRMKSARARAPQQKKDATMVLTDEEWPPQPARRRTTGQRSSSSERTARRTSDASAQSARRSTSGTARRERYHNPEIDKAPMSERELYESLRHNNKTAKRNSQRRRSNLSSEASGPDHPAMAMYQPPEESVSRRSVSSGSIDPFSSDHYYIPPDPSDRDRNDR